MNYVDPCGGLAAEDGAASDGSEELYGASGGTLGGGTPANSEPGLWDKVKSKVDALVTGLTKFNFENRDANNINLSSKDEIGNQPEWRHEYKGAFHQNGETRDEKWVNDLDGREVVYDGDTGQILTDKYHGTYNYINVAPNLKKWYDAGEWLKVGGTMVGHGVMDVAPCYILGIDRK